MDCSVWSLLLARSAIRRPSSHFIFRELACLPIEPDASGTPCLVRQAQDGRRAL